MGEDGKLTQINSNALMDNLNVPEEWGGGGYSDGNNAINQRINANSINPLTGETYAVTYWSSYKEETLDGYGLQNLVKFDTDKYQIELDAKNAVAAK